MFAYYLRHPRRRMALISIGLVMALVLSGVLFSQLSAQPFIKTWTLTADFNEGTLQGTVADNDQVQLGGAPSTFPLMWVANAGEATVSKIDTTTGRELARYRTYFYGTGYPWSGAAPSRTTVDTNGNVYSLNRHFDGRQPMVMKILATGGIDRNGNGIIDTSADLDNDGIVSGAEMLPLLDSNANGLVDAAELQDERIEWVAMVGAAGSVGRAIATGTDGNLWVGTFYDNNFYKVSAADGAVMGGPYGIWPVSPYGALVDRDGILWSASLSSYLGKLDTSTGTATVYSHVGQDYGIAVGNNKVYQSNLSGYTYTEFDPSTNTFTTPAFNKGVSDATIAVAVASNGDIFATKYAGGMYRFDPDGDLIYFSPAQPGTGESRGALVDSDSNVWANHLWNNNISKFRGSDGAWLGVFPVGLQPYTYSDATGITALSITNPTGYWTVIYDGGSAGAQWAELTWNSSVPEGAALEVSVRVADTQGGLEFQNYQVVSAGPISFTGRYIQISTKFTANLAGESPVLYDMTLVSASLNEPPVVDAGPDAQLYSGQTFNLSAGFSDPDSNGPWDFTIDWGDGTASDGSSATQGPGTVVGSRQYLVPGTYEITVTVEDMGGLSGSDEAMLEVERLPVTIDIWPGRYPNIIDPNRQQLVLVVVFTGVYQGVTFDATTIDTGSVLFAGAPALDNLTRNFDIDKDGDLDMVLHFYSNALQLDSSATQASLTGRTSGDIYFAGSDSVHVVPETPTETPPPTATPHHTETPPPTATPPPTTAPHPTRAPD